MPPFTSTNPYQHPRVPAAIISHGVWRYYRFCLSYRAGEALRFARGVMVTYEAIRQGCQRVAQASAHQRRRRRPRRGAKWPLEEVCLTIRGERHSLWRALAPDSELLAILGQRRRDTKAAKRAFRPLLTGCQSAPRGLLTDTRKS